MKALYVLAISAAVLTSWGAIADTTVSTTSRSCKNSAYGPAVCTETTVNSSGTEAPRPKEISAAEERLAREEKEARIRKWQDFCKPAGFIDEMGITRLRYAHPGCDLGRSGEGTLAQVQ
ncbi:MAG: hypothetical protein QOH32_1187 [Bradyrhizobium sp.]|jgi:hypothetical protein|nr:hypothetical protein [Bradyrhizobium sp.]